MVMLLTSRPAPARCPARSRRSAKTWLWGPDWLNMNATAFREVLPSGYRQRADQREVFGDLTVHVLGRRDLMLLKAYAHRPADLRDLEAMEPTGEDIDWLLGHLEGAARLNPHKVAKMEATLYALDPRSRKGRTR